MQVPTYIHTEYITSIPLMSVLTCNARRAITESCRTLSSELRVFSVWPARREMVEGYKEGQTQNSDALLNSQILAVYPKV